MESGKGRIHAVDLVVLAGTLMISIAVGVFFAWKDRKRNTTKHYYFGGGKMQPIPVAASLAVSFVSAIAVLGQPVEIYLYGTVFAWYIIAQIVAAILAAAYFVPVYHRLQIKTVYEYLELRFNIHVRKLTSLLAVINLVLYMGIVTYVPSLALSAVTPLSLEWAIVLTSLVCTFYTTIGGMKAVIWTDLIQALVMVVGMLAMFIQGVLVVGGMNSVIEATYRGERNNLFQFDLDPRTRSTAWSVIFGLGVICCHDTCCNQVYVQRYLSCRTVNSARGALLLSLIPGFLFNLLTVGTGLVLYAYFEGCDPVLSGKISKIDQAVPLMVVEIFQNIPGLAGLFVSTAYCGTLSSISSSINAAAGVVLTDFIVAVFPSLTSSTRVFISKILSFVLGLAAMILAFLISQSSSNVIQIAYTLAGFAFGPLMGLFVMGLFMPWINSKGAFGGLALGFAFTCWLGIGAMMSSTLHSKTTTKLPVSIANCTADLNTTERSQLQETMSPLSTEVAVIHYHNGSVLDHTLYSISPFYSGLSGLLSCIAFGNLVSLITGINKPSEADPKLFVPLLKKKSFRFGVPAENKKTEQETPVDEEKS